MPCTTVTNFYNEGKVYYYCVWFAIKFCFGLDTNDTNAIAINKICKLNFKVFTMYLAISQQQGYQGFIYMVSTFFETLVY